MIEGLIKQGNIEFKNSIDLKNDHNKLGQQLAEKLKKELGTKNNVRFSPSLSTMMYSKLYF